MSDNVKPIILDKFNTIKLYVSDEYACIVSSDNPTIAIFKPNGRAMLKDAATIIAAPTHPITSITIYCSVDLRARYLWIFPILTGYQCRNRAP